MHMSYYQNIFIHSDGSILRKNKNSTTWRDYLATKLLLQSFSNDKPSTIPKIQSLNQRWSFVHWRLLLLCSQATMFLKYKQETLSYPPHKPVIFPFWNLFYSKHFSWLPKTNIQSIYQIFSLLALYNFSEFIHFFIDSFKNGNEVGAAYYNVIYRMMWQRCYVVSSSNECFLFYSLCNHVVTMKLIRI